MVRFLAPGLSGAAWHFLLDGGSSVIKLSPRWNRGRTRLAAFSAIAAASLALFLSAFAGAPTASASPWASTPPPAQAKASIPADLGDAMHLLTSVYYDPLKQKIGPVWWQAGVAMSAVETYEQTTGDTGVAGIIRNVYRLRETASDYENAFDDDTAWWGLALLQAYTITHYAPYLTWAKDIANYIHEDWNTTSACGGGGIWWRRSPRVDLGGAIQNELYLELTAWLHNVIVANHGTDSGKNSYLSWAIQEWTWFQKVGLISNGHITAPTGVGGKTTTIPANLVTNSITEAKYITNSQCTDTIKYDLFTYNQGVILAGLAQLYEATYKNPAYSKEAPGYLTKAEDIANAVLNPKNKFKVRVKPAGHRSAYLLDTAFTVKGVLTEPRCQPNTGCGTGDEVAFKGIFIRDLNTLDTIASKTKYNHYTTKYNKFLTAQRKSIDVKDTIRVTVPSGTYDYLGMWWNGPRSMGTSGTQVSAIEALVAALKLPKAS